MDESATLHGSIDPIVVHTKTKPNLCSITIVSVLMFSEAKEALKRKLNVTGNANLAPVTTKEPAPEVHSPEVVVNQYFTEFFVKYPLSNQERKNLRTMRREIRHEQRRLNL